MTEKTNTQAAGYLTPLNKAGITALFYAAADNLECETSNIIPPDLFPVIEQLISQAKVEAYRTAQQVIAGEDTVPWARRAHGSSAALPDLIEALDDLIEEASEQ